MRCERVWVPSSQGFQMPLDLYCPQVTEEIDATIRRPAVVICPGGGYGYLSLREAEPVALVFAAAGFNTFVAWYRVAPHRHPAPMQDAAAAVAWVRAHAEETHTHPDKIAIMGFSAGGHCAGSLGVSWQRGELWAEMGLTPQEVKPNAMVLCYPVISGGPRAHRGSFENLSGVKDLEAHLQYSLDTQVTPDVCPAFLWHTWDDATVPVENSLLMAQALKAQGATVEMHIFPHGGHGASLCNPQTSGTRSPHLNLPDCAVWPELAQRFLRQMM